LLNIFQIVVGDSKLLKRDPTWNYLVQYCIESQALITQLPKDV
jgi:superfamily I DNA and/or RNA helicase